jgi:hypothetical protein
LRHCMAKMGKYLPAGGDHFNAAIDKMPILNDLRRVPPRDGVVSWPNTCKTTSTWLPLEVGAYLSFKQIQANHSEGFVNEENHSVSHDVRRRVLFRGGGKG